MMIPSVIDDLSREELLALVRRRDAIIAMLQQFRPDSIPPAIYPATATRRDLIEARIDGLVHKLAAARRLSDLLADEVVSAAKAWDSANEKWSAVAATQQCGPRLDTAMRRIDRARDKYLAATAQRDRAQRRFDQLISDIEALRREVDALEESNA